MKPIAKITLVFLTAMHCFFAVTAQKKDYTVPALSDANSWSMILLPDPQTYVKFTRNQPIFELMTSWIGENIKPLNIQMVLCTGDLVEQNNILAPDGQNGNQASLEQWRSVAHSFSRLDGKVPYIAATGNHDYGFKSAENRATNYNTYFPVDKNLKSQALLKEVGADINGQPSLTNAAYELISPHGIKYLFVVLEFAPHDSTLTWAKKVVNKPAYASHRVVVLTHSYLNAKNEHIEKEGYKVENANYGKAIWEKLVKPSKNIVLVFSGHIGAPDDERAHIAFRTDINAAGKKVQQMTFNAQALGGGWHGNGGDGWLRILEFLPDEKRVHVKTFSPLFAISPATQHLAWRRNDYDEFSFSLD
ncbi:metallophosphoesterase [Olivibacter ginsenosidimutans]|uniref:Metallophosphoesterase n=1 Tax=Olivibacter ginsenosidimutans TaxID=1176537 RepID=A0ABP9CB78_9SPHI